MSRTYDRQFIVLNICITLAYYLGGEASLFLHAPESHAPLIWIPTGISVGFGLIYGYRILPGIILGAICVVFSQGPQVDTALNLVGIALQVLAGPLQAVAAIALHRYGSSLLDAKALIKRMGFYLITCVVISPIFSSVPGSLALCLNGLAPWELYWFILFNWWFADALGVQIISLFILAILHPTMKTVPIGSRQILEILVIIAATIIVSEANFNDKFDNATENLHSLEFITFPLIMIAALRFGYLGSAGVCLIVSVIAVTGTASGYGPFAIDGARTNFPLNTFMAAYSVTGLVLAATLAERQLFRDNLLNAQHSLGKIAKNSIIEALGTGVAHELNQPLSTISIHAQLAEQAITNGHPYPADLSLWLKNISENIEFASSIIKRLRRSQTTPAQDRETINVTTLVQDVIEILSPEIIRTNAVVEVQELEQLPEIQSEATLLKQLIINLVINGTEAAEERKDVTPHILITTSLDQNNRVKIDVKDNGRGIPAEEQDQIFNPFFTTKIKGKGLGLAICSSIIESLGGEIWMESTLGQGSTFHIIVPDDTA